MREFFNPEDMIRMQADKGGAGSGGGGKEKEDNRSPKEKIEEVLLNTYFDTWSDPSEFQSFISEMIPLLNELESTDGASLQEIIENLTGQFVDEIDISELEDSDKKKVKTWFKSRFVRKFASGDNRSELLDLLEGNSESRTRVDSISTNENNNDNNGNTNPPDGGVIDLDDNHEDEPDDWKILFNKKWDILNDTYRERLISDPSLITLMNELNDIVEEHFSEEEKAIYKRTLLMRDTAVEFSGPFRHLVLKDIEGAHKKAYNNEAKELRDFMNSEENIFGVSIKEVTTFLEEDAFEKQTHTRRDGSTFNWSYAANGDPEDENQHDITDDDENVIRGAIPLKDLLKETFPLLEEAPDFLLDSFIFFTIVSELRYKKFYPFYDYYQNSPINGMNAEALLPWGVPGYLTYKAASITKIPGYKAILLLTKYPGEDSNFGGNGSISVSFDKHWANNRFHENKTDRDGNHINKEFVENRRRTFVTDVMTDANYKENRFKGALEKRKDMITIRNILKWKFSPDVDFGNVELHEDMQLLPSTWDIIKGKWRGEDINITLDDIFEVYKQFDIFAKTIDNVPKIENPLQAFSLLSDLISNTSKFKMIFNKLEGDVFSDFKELVNLMYMFYIKQLFDQYIVFNKEDGLLNKFKPKHVLFAEGIIEEVEDAKTLPGHIKKFIVKAMKEVKVVPSSKWGIVFYPQTLDNDTPIFLRIQKAIGTNLSGKLDRWLKPASPSEKDPNK